MSSVLKTLAYSCVFMVFVAACGEDTCGDGEVLLPELCDDGNRAGGDGCDSQCEVEMDWICFGTPSVCERAIPNNCGNGALDIGEQCDEGSETATCDRDCTEVVCGDGLLNTLAMEQCDDGNRTSGDGCSDNCQTEGPPVSMCGDGICAADEPCDCTDCVAEMRCQECPDFDEDGFEDSACGGMDCNDENADVNPDGTEVPCNRIDEDCNPMTRDALDADMDGSSCNYDCDDGDPQRSPLFREICGNEIDDDCDSDTPDILDSDRDGFLCNVDCNDYMASVCPTCPEVCNNVLDDDCDPSTPDVFDADMDGSTCDVDCDDGNADVFPGKAEICANMIDDDCDVMTVDRFDNDADGDFCDTDCDDRDPTRASTFMENCGNGIDDDCDAMTPDLEDADMDMFFCDVDCDDSDPMVVPDSLLRCGPAFTISEGFEMGAAGWTGTGSWARGVPSATFIGAAAGGTNAWVTNLSGSYSNSEMSFLTSPALDFSMALTDPSLRFSHIFQTESCCDEGWVEISTDGGTVWRKVGVAGMGVNWYNDATGDYWNGSSGDSGAWRTAQYPLVGTARQPDVRIRFVFSSDGSVTQEGFGVDDINIGNQFIDAAVTSVMLEQTCASASHPVSIVVRNAGDVPLRSFEVAYSADGAAFVTETVSSTLLPGRTYQHTFATAADLSRVGPHAVLGRVTAMMDGSSGNNQRVQSVNVDNGRTIVLGTGYSEDFEMSGGGWVAGGSSTTWAWGTPADMFISGAASGSSAWVTNLTGDHASSEDSHLTSPCFDFSAVAADPMFSMSQIFSLATFANGATVEVMTPNSGGWVLLGETGEGVNWYNDSFYDAWSGTSGAAGAWRTARHLLDDTAGESRVRIRIRFLGDSWLSSYEGFGFDDVAVTP